MMPSANKNTDNFGNNIVKESLMYMCQFLSLTKSLWELEKDCTGLPMEMITKVKNNDLYEFVCFLDFIEYLGF